MGSKRVVITGLGAITPIGKNVNEYQNSLFSGLSGCENIVSFDTSKFKTKFACEVKNYDPLDYFDRKESRKMDIYAQFGMIAAEEAVNDSELNLENVDLSTTIFGKKLDLPFYCAPTALQRLFHYEGERAVGKAAQKFGTMFVCLL